MPGTAEIKQIIAKDYHNYIAFFLTFRCNLQCSYCLNVDNDKTRKQLFKRSHLDTADWIKAVNRLVLRDDLPLTLQGGEPTVYEGFYEFVNGVKDDIKLDLLTNMIFDAEEFVRRVPVRKFTRDAPYASIRVSYHPGQNDIDDLIRKTMVLQEAGFQIGLYGILHPDEKMRTHILSVQEKCHRLGIDFRTKEFLGMCQGKLYGTYKYDGAVGGRTRKNCQCKTTELLVDSVGYVYRCHSDLYHGRTPYAHILDDDFSMEDIDRFRPCEYFGLCHPCDLKLKTNRFQVFGHTSVAIKEITNRLDTA